MVKVGVGGLVQADIDALLSLLDEPHKDAACRQWNGGFEGDVREPVVGIRKIVGLMDGELRHQFVAWLTGVILIFTSDFQGEVAPANVVTGQ